MISATGQMVPFFFFASQKHLFYSCGQGKFHAPVYVGRAFLERLSNKMELTNTQFVCLDTWQPHLITLEISNSPVDMTKTNAQPPSLHATTLVFVCVVKMCLFEMSLEYNRSASLSEARWTLHLIFVLSVLQCCSNSTSSRLKWMRHTSTCPRASSKT